MIHYQLIGAVRDPYISKYEVEIRRERLEAIKEEMIYLVVKLNITVIKLLMVLLVVIIE